MSFRLKNALEIVNSISVRIIAGGCLFVGSGVSVSAQQCDCLVPLSSVQSGQIIGQLTSAVGQINVLGGNGWVAATSGAPLYVGSRVETGPASSTRVSVGQCSLNLGSQAALSIVPTEQALCVAVANTTPPVAAQANNPVVMGIAAGIGATAGVIAISTGDDNPASP
ncbi:hypothetical protein [Ochrobactrum sp. A-1]|uniref:hypothetical protein n=1 Tax=Ochrobactrum sp. A-1 TaxID=2920940 RepID=UPI001F0AD192|nr:hypothetical protein [Ochrobactrum sp. A-1]